MDSLASSDRRLTNILPPPAASPNPTLAALFGWYKVDPIWLQRTQDGRLLSVDRCHRAEEFMFNLSIDAEYATPDVMYAAGVVVQLTLSSHLLDVGFPDDWCARHIGLNVDRSLAFANATGLGYDCAETARLIAVLSPYWKWNRRHHIDRPVPDNGGFSAVRVRELVGALLGHVSQVTGHKPPMPS